MGVWKKFGIKNNFSSTPPSNLNYDWSLRLILKENFFHFNGKHYLQNLMELQWAQRQQFWFLCQCFHDIKTTTLSKTVFRKTVWKCYIHDIFSLWDMSKPDIEAFIEQANFHHPSIEFTAETFDTETAFLDTVVYKLRHKIQGKIYPWCKDPF